MHAQKLDEKCDAYKLWVIRLEMKLLLQVLVKYVNCRNQIRFLWLLARKKIG
jgi:hypothetical protein